MAPPAVAVATSDGRVVVLCVKATRPLRATLYMPEVYGRPRSVPPTPSAMVRTLPFRDTTPSFFTPRSSYAK